MLPVSFNKNINKKSDFGTVRFEFGTEKYEFYKSSREPLYFYSIFSSSIYRFLILKFILEKNFGVFLTKISIITSHRYFILYAERNEIRFKN
jgi:hypothetical protein